MEARLLMLDRQSETWFEKRSTAKYQLENPQETSQTKFPNRAKGNNGQVD